MELERQGGGTMISPRNALWAGVSSLWTIVTLLKLQPQMFSANLFINVLGPTAADSQPAWLHALLNFFDKLWVQHPALANVSVFAIEAIIVVLLWLGPDRRAGRIGLWALIVWGVMVWVIGEAFGSLLTGDASVMSEAPGASIVYVAAGILLLVPPRSWLDGRMLRWLRIGLGAFWLFGAFLQVQPAFWTGPGLAGIFGDVTMNGTQPPFMAQIINVMVTTTFLHAALWNALFVLIMVVLGVQFLRGRGGRQFAAFALLWTLFLWISPQAFGGLWAGTATDPGTAVPLALLTFVTLFSFRTNTGTHAARDREEAAFSSN